MRYTLQPKKNGSGYTAWTGKTQAASLRTARTLAKAMLRTGGGWSEGRPIGTADAVRVWPQGGYGGRREFRLGA